MFAFPGYADKVLRPSFEAYLVLRPFGRKMDWPVVVYAVEDVGVHAFPTVNQLGLGLAMAIRSGCDDNCHMKRGLVTRANDELPHALHRTNFFFMLRLCG